MKAYVCNRCGRVVTIKDAMDNMTNIVLRNDLVGVYSEYHLCKECKSKFQKWIENEEQEGVEMP